MNFKLLTAALIASAFLTMGYADSMNKKMGMETEKMGMGMETEKMGMETEKMGMGMETEKMGMEKMDEMPFGGKRNVAFSKKLWDKLEAMGLNSTPANLYIGGPPHGKVREVLEGMIEGKRVIVKRNYGGEGVSLKNVAENRAKYLKAVTVMMKRNKGYDPKNNDWFWAKYKADGSLYEIPTGTEIAGKFPGCISCHSSASGGDLVFKHNKEANADVVYVK